MTEDGKTEVGGPVEKEQGEDAMPPTYEEAKGLTEEEPKVKITSSDTKIEMGKEKEAQEGFKGLTKDELMHYANDPFWVRLRWVLFSLFWVIWAAMLVASVLIIVQAPKCPSPDPKQWWQKGPVYKFDVTAFPDTNADGNGDLAGVEEQVAYLVSAGVGTAYFTNLVSTSNLKEVDQDLGTMEEWESLATALQERGLRVIIDFTTEQTSEMHMWYEEAQAGNAEFSDFYKPGSNELNLENPAVVKELERALQFWLEHGVDGFVVRGVGQLPDSVLTTFHGLLESEGEKAGVPKVLLAEDDFVIVEYSGVGAGKPVHLVNFGSDIVTETTAEGIKSSLDDFITELTGKCVEDACPWPAFAISTVSHGKDKVDALTMLKMLLPGTVVTTAGEELGLAGLDFAKITEAPESGHLALYSLLAAKLRHQDAILFGELTTENSFVKQGSVFGLTRVKKGSPGYILVWNLGAEDLTVDLSEVAAMPESIRVLEGASTLAVSPVNEGEEKRCDSKAVPLLAGQAKIFNFVPNFD